MEKGHPPLTSIVLGKYSHRPGSGFIAWHGHMSEAHSRVFSYPWSSVQRPFDEDVLSRTGSYPNHFNIPSTQYAVPDSKVTVNGRGPYQDFYRRMLHYSYRGACALCDTRLSHLLVASHIVPWAVDPAIRLDPHNGILLCKQHDALFEHGTISIGVDGMVNVRKLPLDPGVDLKAFLERTRARLRNPRPGFEPNPRFLQWRVAKAKQ